jgi:hypothetical protein
MAPMRLFAARDLPGEVVRNLEALLVRLRPAARIRWCPRSGPAKAPGIEGGVDGARWKRV